MAIDRAAEARKKARAKRLARREKSKGAIGRFFKGSKRATKVKAKKAPVYKTGKDYKAGPIDQAAADKKVQERKAANRKKEEEKKTVSKAKVAKEREASKAREKARLEAMPVYKSKKDYSKAGSPKKTPSFGSAFASARKAGKKTFTWKGKPYTTKTADDAKKVTPKSKPKAKPKVLPKKTKEPIGQSYEVEEPIGQSYEVEEKPKPKYPPATKASRPPRKFKYEGGGKVKADNPYGWPTKDTGNGGN